MNGVTVRVVPIGCWVIWELVVELPAAFGVLLEPVTTGRVSPSKNLAWLPWLVTTEGTVRIVELLFRGVVERLISAERSMYLATPTGQSVARPVALDASAMVTPL